LLKNVVEKAGCKAHGAQHPRHQSGKEHEFPAWGLAMKIPYAFLIFTVVAASWVLPPSAREG
jgi:hypothetical protein